MWSSGPASHGQFSGNGCREQVITRQPAAEKRFTVAWPMPRLAPVRSSVRRGWLLVAMVVRFISRIEARLGPGCPRLVSRESNAIVQAIQSFLPEFDFLRYDTIARPEWRPWHGTDAELRGIDCDCLLERQPAFQRRGLLARPSADLRHARPCREVGVGFLFRNWVHRAARTHLALQRFPVKRQRSVRRGLEFMTLDAVGIGVKYEAALIEALHQYHTRVGHPIGPNG